MRAWLARRGPVLVFSVLVLLSVARPSWTPAARQVAAQAAPDNPEAVLDYIVAHPGDVSLVAYRADDPARAILWQPDQARPLASTIKILVLAEYARQVEAGRLSPQERVGLDDVEAYYLPNSDGGAHPRALSSLGSANLISVDRRVTLKALVGVMVSESDNAATDYLVNRLGRAALEATPGQLGVPDQAPPLPLSAQFLLWRTIGQAPDTTDATVGALQADGSSPYADRVYADSRQYASDTAYRAAERVRWNGPGPGQAANYRLADALYPRGTARAYAQLMEHAQRGDLLSPGVSATMREALEWPMKFASNQRQFLAFGTKGGSIGGMLTEASYYRTRTPERTVVVALFFEHLPPEIYNGLRANFAHQSFMRRLATDDAFFANVQARLAPAPAE